MPANRPMAASYSDLTRAFSVSLRSVMSMHPPMLI
jgi:hypothetical protein